MRRSLFVLAISLAIRLGGGSALAGPIPIAVEDANAPWSQRDGTGYANDLVRAAFKAAGVEVELSVVPYARAKDMALNGKTAACLNLTWLPEYEGKIVLPDEPLFVCYIDYFTSRTKPLKATREADFSTGTVVGIVIGYEYPPSLYALRDKGIVVLEESESEELNLKKLSKGRIDTALVYNNETKPAELLLARAGVGGQVAFAFRSVTLPSYIGFSKKHPRGAEALAAFNKGWRIISANGTRREIEKNWQDRALEEVARLAGKTAK